LPLAVPITALIHIDLAGNGTRDPGGVPLSTHVWSAGLGISAQIATMRTGIDLNGHQLSKQTPGS
jgi:hypothetical protein